MPYLGKECTRLRNIACITCQMSSALVLFSILNILSIIHSTQFNVYNFSDVNRAQKYGKQIRQFVWLSCFLNIGLVLGEVVISKWIPDISHFYFSEIPKNQLKMDPRTPYLLQTYFKQYKKIDTIYKTSVLWIQESKLFFGKYASPFFEN